MFYVLETNHRDCELRLKTGNLDYEIKNKYLLTVRLVTVGGLIGKLTEIILAYIFICGSNNNSLLVLFRDYTCKLTILTSWVSTLQSPTRKVFIFKLKSFTPKVVSRDCRHLT